MSWVDAMVNGCTPSTCRGGCGIMIDGFVFRFAACQFGQETAGSPLGSIVRAVARYFARLPDPVLRAGRNRRDPSRLSCPHGGHGPTAAAVIAWGRAPRDLRGGCDRGDPPRSSRHHGGHGHTTGAVIAVTAAGAAPPARWAGLQGGAQGGWGPVVHLAAHRKSVR
jgi:hypothetical protein